MLTGFVTGMILLPFLGSLSQLLLRNRAMERDESVRPVLDHQVKFIGLAASVFSSLLGLTLLIFKHLERDFVPRETLSWVSDFAISYDVSVDGLSAIGLILIQTLVPVVLLSEFDRKQGGRGFFGLTLLLQSILLGLVCSQDLFLLFVLSVFSVFPIFFLTSIWGDQARKEASLRYLVLSFLGIGMTFVGILMIYNSFEPKTFSIDEVSKLSRERLDFAAAIPFWLIFSGFALRLPVFPWSGWFASLVSQSSPSVLMLLCGLYVPILALSLSKILLPIFPRELREFSGILLILGTFNLLLFSLMTVARKKISEICSDLSGILFSVFLLGICSLEFSGSTGGVFELLSGGLSICLVAILAQILTERSRSDAFLDDEGNPRFGGMVLSSPAFGVLGAIAFCSVLALPGLSGFISHSLVFMGLHSVKVGWGVGLFLSSVILGLSIFRSFKAVFLGPSASDQKEFKDLSSREVWVFLPVVLVLVVLGIYPRFLIDLLREPMSHYLSLLSN